MNGDKGLDNDTKSISNITLFLRDSSSCMKIAKLANQNPVKRELTESETKAIIPSKNVQFLQPLLGAFLLQ